MASKPCREADSASEAALSGKRAPSVWKIAVVALFGALLAQLDATIVNVSLANLSGELGVRFSTIQWVTSGYLLALTLVLPLNGWLVDRIGAKTLYLWCFAGFTLTSALCALAWSANTLIVFRLLQGVSGGLLAPMAQMMVARAAGKNMTRVAGYMSLPVLLAPILGPVAAGAILQYASWRWLFLVNLPIGILAFVLAVLFLPPDSEDGQGRKLDWMGLALLSPGMGAFLYGADKLGENVGRALFIIGAGLMVTFILLAMHKGRHALIDVRLFRGRVFSTSAATQFLSNGAQFAGQMLIPAFLINACGQTASAMGWMLAPMGIGMMVTLPLMGALTDRFGIRRVSASGALLTLLATLPFLYLAMQGLHLFVLIPALFLRGMGMSAVGLPSMTAAYASVPRSELPMATTSLNIVQRLGGPTITTLCAAVLTWHSAVPEPGVSTSMIWIPAFLLLCTVHAVTVLMSARLPRRLSDLPDAM